MKATNAILFTGIAIVVFATALTSLQGPKLLSFVGFNNESSSSSSDSSEGQCGNGVCDEGCICPDDCAGLWGEEAGCPEDYVCQTTGLCVHVPGGPIPADPEPAETCGNGVCDEGCICPDDCAGLWGEEAGCPEDYVCQTTGLCVHVPGGPTD